MGFLTRLAARFRAAEGQKRYSNGDDFWYEPFNRATGAGIRVTPEIAIKATAVFACVSLLAETMAALPLHVYRRLATGGREPAPDHPLEELLSVQSNDTDTAFDFWGTMIWHLFLRGTAYARIVAGARGPIDQLIPLHPSLVRPERYGNPKVPKWRFRVRDPLTGTEEVLLADEIFRVPGIIAGGVLGMGLCDHADEAIALGIAADQYAARVFSQNLNMGFIVTHPGKLSEEAKTNFINTFIKRASGVANLHRPILLQENMKVEKMSMTAKDAQMEEARKWQTLEIARRLRIPPHMLGIADGATHSNVEEQGQNLVRYTLLPLGTRIEQAIRRDLITAPTTYTAKFNFEGLLRGNAQARADYFSKALGAGGSPGWMTVNEIREIEGYNALPGEEFNRPPIGTNPSNEPRDVTPRPPPPKRLPPPTPPDDDEEEEETRHAAPPCPVASAEHTVAVADVPATPSVDDAAQALVRKEIAALRRAAMRYAHDAGAWRTYAKSFYGGHVSDVMARLGVAKDAAATYCRARSAQCHAAAAAEFLDHLARAGAGEAAALARAPKETAHVVS